MCVNIPLELWLDMLVVYFGTKYFSKLLKSFKEIDGRKTFKIHVRVTGIILFYCSTLTIPIIFIIEFASNFLPCLSCDITTLSSSISSHSIKIID